MTEPNRRRDDNAPTEPMVYYWPQVILDDKTKNMLTRAKLLADTNRYLAEPAPISTYLNPR